MDSDSAFENSATNAVASKKKGKSKGAKGKERVIRTIDDKETLISEVSKHPAIWKKGDDSHHSRDAVRLAWDTVSVKLNIPVDESKSLWKNLKDSLAAKLRRVKGVRSGDGVFDGRADDADKAKKLHFFEMMPFMEEPLPSRNTDSNYKNEDKGSEAPITHQEMSAESTTVELEDRRPSRKSDKGAKRSNLDSVLTQLGHHMELVGQAIAAPVAIVPGNRFLRYLEGIMEVVPAANKRRCEQQIINLVNAYVDDTEQNVIIVEDEV